MRISDWSSDVCSSDLITMHVPAKKIHRIIAVREWPENVRGLILADVLAIRGDLEVCQICEPWDRDGALLQLARRKRELERSEERRVGKEFVSKCNFRWAPDH